MDWVDSRIGSDILDINFLVFEKNSVTLKWQLCLLSGKV